MQWTSYQSPSDRSSKRMSQNPSVFIDPGVELAAGHLKSSTLTVAQVSPSAPLRCLQFSVIFFHLLCLVRFTLHFEGWGGDPRNKGKTYSKQKKLPGRARWCSINANGGPTLVTPTAYNEGHTSIFSAAMKTSDWTDYTGKKNVRV